MAEIGRYGDISGRFVPDDGTAAVNVVVKDKKAIRINAAETTNETVDLYLTIDVITPNITVNTAIDDKAITVNSAVGAVAGHAVTITEGSRHFQTIIKSVVGNVLNLASGLDYAYTTAARVRVGLWNLNANGSVTNRLAYIEAPPNAILELHEFRISISDDTAMDSSKFGGITALTNGIVFRVTDGMKKNGPLIVNNIGFAEQGFVTQYDDKAPTGLYGIRAVRNLKTTSGTVLHIDGSDSGTVVLRIQDNLTGLSQMTCTVSGNVHPIE